ncbi:hypothetical protein ACQRBF_01360 [Peptoniphilaceae bacterium SGI.131]
MRKPIKTFSFGDLYKNLIFLEDKRTLTIFKNGYQLDIRGDEDGILAYAYVDKEGELVFSAMSVVTFKDGKAVFNDEPLNRNLKHRIRLTDIEGVNAEILNLDSEDIQPYIEPATKINEENFISEEVEAVRYNRQIDKFRNLSYPDDLEAYIFSSEENKIEGVWARAFAMTDKAVLAKLITSPSALFGYSKDEDIDLQLYEINGAIRLMKIL